MAASDPTERSELARLAALARWSKTPDRTKATQAARDARLAKFDPGPSIPEPQRSKMIQAALEAEMIRMRRARRPAAERRSPAERHRDKLAIIAEALDTGTDDAAAL